MRDCAKLDQYTAALTHAYTSNGKPKAAIHICTCATLDGDGFNPAQSVGLDDAGGRALLAFLKEAYEEEGE